MNILKRLFDKICLFFVISLIFISCSDFSSGKEWTNISSKGRISISTNLSNAESRTVLPNGSFFTEASGYKWELSAQKSGETSSKVVGTWEDVINSTTGIITTAYKNMTEGSFDILIDVGTYNFNLVATKDGKRVLEGSIINGNIVSGECNRLNFTMKEASGTDIANGSINFKLILKKIGVVSNIKANLSELDGSAVVCDENLIPIPADDNSCEYVVFENDSISAGNYMLKLELQQNGVEETIGVYTCIIRVAPGLCSQGEYILEELAELYTITYELNNGNFNENLVDNCYPYNKYTSVVLPTPTREDYAFGGWYNNASLTGEKITEIANGSAENITLYAKWLQLYTITYNLNGGINAESNPTSYTVETEKITLGTPTKNSSTFLGWYNDSGEVITEIKPSETAANITVTARWRTTCTAQDVNGVITSLSVDGPHDIVVTGEITGDTIATIKSALDTLVGTNSTAKVNLDLRETTVLTSIDNEAFKDCTNLTSIIIPYGVISIGNSAFSHCSQLTSITFPESVTTIGINVFDACSELTSFIVHESNQNFSTLEDGKILCDKNKETLIAYPSASGSITILNGIKTIAGNAFIECKGLTEISIPDSVTTICDGAFANTGFTSVSLPNSITEIGINVFFGCSSLETVTLPNRITSIPTGTFFVCSSLSNIEIPDDVTSIGGDAFSYCNSVKTLVIGNSLTSFEFLPIAKDALESITIGNGITEIGENKFKDFTNLKSVTIGSGVTKIGTSAFENCTGLTSVTIPDNVTSIGYRAFENCKSVKTLVIGKGLTSLDYLPITSALESITIGENITSIANDRFYYCQSLESVVIPNKVTSIGSKAFYACINLKNVIIGNGVESIGESAFQECNRLQSVVIPDSVTSIGKNAFHKCYDLTTVEIGSGVETIGDYAFYRCDTLTSFIVDTGNSNYSSSSDGIILCNKEGDTLIAYPTAKGNVEIPDFIKTIGARSFESMTNITSVTIPEGITTIENNAFDKCSGLTSVVLPNSITEMGINIFWECSNLKTVKLPNRITSIPDSTFFLCGSLSNIEIPEGVTSIKYDAFANCSSLTSIVIPASVTSIIRGAFYNSGLTTVNYRGTEDQWEQIVIDSSYNDKLINATKNFNYKEE